MLDFPRWKILLVISICLAGIYFSLPNFFQKSDLLPENKVNLGLDLRGGSYLLLEIDFNDFLKDQLDNVKADIRKNFRGKTVNNSRILYKGGLRTQGDKIIINLVNPETTDQVVSIIEEISDNYLVDSTAGGKIEVSFRDYYLEEMKKNVMDQSIEIVRRRVDETGTTEPDIQRQGDFRILLQVPGIEDPENLKRLLGKTAKLTFHLLDETRPISDNSLKPLPAGTMRLKQLESDENPAPIYYAVKKQAALSGELLTHANFTTHQFAPAVSFRFNSLGAKIFAELSEKNVGKVFAIVLDNKVVSAPVFREPILDGNGVISGNFTEESANNLAILLRAGALPAPIKIIEERTVGPSLGSDSIAAGEKAVLAGICLVIVFMLLFYGKFGVFSNISLLINLVLIIAILSLFKATLTLPGIAGIVLTIGMAVDANVLIFERIKEEVSLGKTTFAAVENGFSQAFKTIVDANITTLIAALLLFFFGSGPIKGFAITLSIGIFTSMISAILITRMFIVLWLKKKRPSKLPI